MKLLARVNGTEIPFDGQQIDLVELQPGVYSALLGDRSVEVFVEALDGSAYRATIDGFAHAVELTDPRSYSSAAGAGAEGGPQTIKAQMPGKVIELLAAAGDEVRAEQGILVVEAMKMQNEIRAPRAGRLVSINVAPGDSVETGRALAVLE